MAKDCFDIAFPAGALFLDRSQASTYEGAASTGRTGAGNSRPPEQHPGIAIATATADLERVEQAYRDVDGDEIERLRVVLDAERQVMDPARIPGGGKHAGRQTRKREGAVREPALAEFIQDGPEEKMLVGVRGIVEQARQRGNVESAGRHEEVAQRLRLVRPHRKLARQLAVSRWT